MSNIIKKKDFNTVNWYLAEPKTNTEDFDPYFDNYDLTKDTEKFIQWIQDSVEVTDDRQAAHDYIQGQAEDLAAKLNPYKNWSNWHTYKTNRVLNSDNITMEIFSKLALSLDVDAETLLAALVKLKVEPKDGIDLAVVNWVELLDKQAKKVQNNGN